MAEKFNAKARHEAAMHRWKREKEPPQLRHEAWLLRGDTTLHPAERPPVRDAFSLSGLRPAAASQRRDTVCRSHFATRRAPGGGQSWSEPLSRGTSSNSGR
mmetsp:Transcript_37782/g.84417  ORF Transcript_37782/g.84417 Transcript_37782/m.84417 type:complete len:101 (-) Transcript_37782:4-306(-)